MANLTEVVSTQPLRVPRSVRMNELRVLTSGKAGKILPIAYVPMLREDRVVRGQVRVRFEMAETVKTLMNAVNVTVYAHFVPFLAFERFNGLDQMNRAYQNVPETEGGSTVPFFKSIGFDRTAGVFKTLGLHAKQGVPVNAAIVEAYNCIVNFRRKARSTKLPLRTEMDTSLAAGFWKNPLFREIVPDFDQAMIDGEVALNVVQGKLPVRGLWHSQASDSSGYAGGFTYADNATDPGLTNANSRRLFTDFSIARPRVWAELAQANVKISLSNIEMAKQTAAFARLRKQYQGVDEDYLIDLLMEGFRVPDAELQQPLLLDRKSTVMGYSRRFATDGANLDQSVTTGETAVDMVVRTPPMNTGGIIMITAEIVPEQLFERAQDHFLTKYTVADLPSFLRDFLDPEKVAIVQNQHVDVEHATPTGTFGYAPLNHQWQRKLCNIGGKFQRQLGDPFIEDRQRLWAVEQLNPQLTSDFYLVNSIHHNVFADTVSDPFEITALGRFQIIGNTVFGKGLDENTMDYEAVLAEIDAGRITQTATMQTQSEPGSEVEDAETV